MADTKLPDINAQINALPYSQEVQDKLYYAFYDDDPYKALEAVKDVPANVKQALFDIRGKAEQGKSYSLEDIYRSGKPSKPSAPTSVGLSDKGLPKVVSNNNPLALRPSQAEPFQGEEKGGSGGFAKFSTPSDGVRAAVLTIQNYQSKYGLNTLRKILHRYAPKEDKNDPDTYADIVAKQTGLGPDDEIDTQDPELMRKVVRAMANVEISNKYASLLEDDINAGVDKAFGKTPEIPSVSTEEAEPEQPTPAVKSELAEQEIPKEEWVGPKEAIREREFKATTAIPVVGKSPEVSPTPFAKKKEVEVDFLGRPVQPKTSKAALAPKLVKLEKPKPGAVKESPMGAAPAPATAPPPVVTEPKTAEPPAPLLSREEMESRYANYIKEQAEKAEKALREKQPKGKVDKGKDSTAKKYQDIQIQAEEIATPPSPVIVLNPYKPGTPEYEAERKRSAQTPVEVVQGPAKSFSEGLGQAIEYSVEQVPKTAKAISKAAAASEPGGKEYVTKKELLESGKTMREPLARPELLVPGGDGRKDLTREFVRGTLEAVGGLTAPETIAVVAGTKGLGTAAGLATGITRSALKAATSALSAYFTGQAGVSAYEKGKEAVELYEKGDYEAAARALGVGSIDALFALMGAAHSGKKATESFKEGYARGKRRRAKVEAETEAKFRKKLEEDFEPVPGEPGVFRPKKAQKAPQALALEKPTVETEFEVVGEETPKTEGKPGVVETKPAISAPAEVEKPTASIPLDEQTKTVDVELAFTGGTIKPYELPQSIAEKYELVPADQSSYKNIIAQTIEVANKIDLQGISDLIKEIKQSLVEVANNPSVMEGMSYPADSLENYTKFVNEIQIPYLEYVKAKKETAGQVSAQPQTAQATPAPPSVTPQGVTATPPSPAVSTTHPKLSDAGEPVVISKPSTPTPDATWEDASKTAVFTPTGNAPVSIGKVEMKSWNPPQEGWSKIPGTKESLDVRNPFEPIAGKKTGAGVIVVEDDGRIWLISPTNEFGGYKNTFPKGTVDPSLTMQENAIKEAWEETGLKVDIIGVLGDYERGTSKARYYIATRSGGSPKDMGWEAQAVNLATITDAKSLLNQQVDQKILTDLENMISSGKLGEIKDGTPRKLSSYGPEKAPKTEGSNPGGWYGDQPGDKWLIKGNKQKQLGTVTPEQSDNRASNEVLASEFIRSVVPTGAPKMKLVDLEGKYGGGLGVASKAAENLVPFDKNNPDHLSAAQKTFALHAWLANYDVLGMGYDNTFITPDGNAINIDPGGALLFRAQGLPKGASHGVTNGLLDPSAPEFESMRTNTSEQKAVFGKMTQEQLKQSAEILEKVTDEQIKKLVNTYGWGTDTEKAALADNLIKRRNAILGKVGLTAATQPTAISTVQPPTTPAPPAVAPISPPPGQMLPSWQIQAPSAASAASQPTPVQMGTINSSQYAIQASVPKSVARAWNSTDFSQYEFHDNIVGIMDSIYADMLSGSSPQMALQDAINSAQISAGDEGLNDAKKNAWDKGIIPYLEYLNNKIQGKSDAEVKDILNEEGKSLGMVDDWQSTAESFAASLSQWVPEPPQTAPSTAATTTPPPAPAVATQPPPQSTTGITTVSYPAALINSLTVPNSIAQAFSKTEFDPWLFASDAFYYLNEISFTGSIGADIASQFEYFLNQITAQNALSYTQKEGIYPYLKYLKKEFQGKSVAEAKEILDKAGQSFGEPAGWTDKYPWPTISTASPAAQSPTPPAQASSAGTAVIDFPPQNVNAVVPVSVYQAFNTPGFNKQDFFVNSINGVKSIYSDLTLGYTFEQAIDEAISNASYYSTLGPNDPSVKKTFQEGVIPYLEYLKQKLQGKSNQEIGEELKKEAQSFGSNNLWVNAYGPVAPSVPTSTQTPPSPAVATQPPPTAQAPVQPTSGSQIAAAAASSFLAGNPVNVSILDVGNYSFLIPEFVMQSYQQQDSGNQNSFNKNIEEVWLSAQPGGVGIANKLSSMISLAQAKLADYKNKIASGTASQFDKERAKYYEDLMIPYLEYLEATGIVPIKSTQQSTPVISSAYVITPSYGSPNQPLWSQQLEAAGIPLPSIKGGPKKVIDPQTALAFYGYNVSIYGDNSPKAKKALKLLNAKNKNGVISQSAIDAFLQSAQAAYGPLKNFLSKIDAHYVDVMDKYIGMKDTFKYPWDSGSSLADPSLKSKFSAFQTKQINKVLKGNGSPTQEQNDMYYALQSYTGGWHNTANKAIADLVINGTPIPQSIKSKIALVDKAIGQIKLGHDLLLNRSIASKYLFSYFGLSTNPSQIEISSLIGRKYKELGIVSASMKPTWKTSYQDTSEGQLDFVIKAGAEFCGVRSHSLSNHPNEAEVTLPRGTTYIIEDIKKIGPKKWEAQVSIVAQIQEPF
jgi:ADP-ribose pyrophosphatase YjhB (NUDIX family)